MHCLEDCFLSIKICGNASKYKIKVKRIGESYLIIKSLKGIFRIIEILKNYSKLDQNWQHNSIKQLSTQIVENSSPINQIKPLKKISFQQPLNKYYQIFYIFENSKKYELQQNCEDDNSFSLKKQKDHFTLKDSLKLFLDLHTDLTQITYELLLTNWEMRLVNQNLLDSYNDNFSNFKIDLFETNRNILQDSPKHSIKRSSIDSPLYQHRKKFSKTQVENSEIDFLQDNIDLYSVKSLNIINSFTKPTKKPDDYVITCYINGTIKEWCLNQSINYISTKILNHEANFQITGTSSCLVEKTYNEDYIFTRHLNCFGGKTMLKQWHFEGLTQYRDWSDIIEDRWVYCLKISPKDDYLFIGGKDGVLKQFSIKNFKLEKDWSDSCLGIIVSICITPNGDYLFTVGKRRITQWSLKGGDLYKTWSGCENVDFWAMEVSPDGRYLYIGGDGGLLKMFDIETQRLKKDMSCVKYGNVRSLRITGDGVYLFIGSMEGRLVQYCINDGVCEDWSNGRVNLRSILLASKSTKV